MSEASSFAVSSTYSMGGAANTSPGHAPSSIPLPTTMTCAGSWPDPEPWMIDTLSWLGASARMIRLYSGT